MPYAEPIVSGSAQYQLFISGPGNSSYSLSGSVQTPLNDSGSPDPVVQDAAFQALVNAIDSLPDFSVPSGSKSSSIAFTITPDAV